MFLVLSRFLALLLHLANKISRFLLLELSLPHHPVLDPALEIARCKVLVGIKLCQSSIGCFSCFFNVVA